MADMTIVNGIYKPTYNWGAPSCIPTMKISNQVIAPEWSKMGQWTMKKSQQQCLSGLNLGWDMCLTPVCLTPMLIFFGDNQYFWAPDFQANQFLVMSGCQASISPPTGSAKSAAGAARAWRARSAASAFPTCRGWVKGTIFHRKS